MAEKAKVLLRRTETYDPAAVAAIIRTARARGYGPSDLGEVEIAGDITAGRVVLLGSCTEVDWKITARHRRRIRGCPPKRKTLVLLFFLKAGIINPLFRLDLIIDAYPFLYLTWLKRFFSGRF